MDLLNVQSPSGTEWELLIGVLVVLIGPILMERFRIPGLIGLLVGGLLIGPGVLGIVPEDGGIVKSLGEVGLIYLMFTAGLELDLDVFARYRKQAITFAMITFAVPLVAGVGVGLGFGMDVSAAILLGSLLASHTLISYPTIRRQGLAANSVVASAVGATVLTDTLALVVLAVISGEAGGSASGGELVAQVGLGLLVVAGFSFLVLPRVTRLWFATFGRQQTLRYTFAFAALLAGATVASVVSIEPIVGAFFCGLALNRLVPNEGDFMEHIEFFGSSLLIPIFLVSVGTVIDPSVLVDPGTLALAGGFIAACLGGKLIAAATTKPMFGASWDEVGVVFSLTVAQTAATLAATFVGYNLGLFTINVVNAVMLLILVSLLASSITAKRFGTRVPRPPVDAGRVGRSVLVPIEPDEPVSVATRVAAWIASADTGLLHPLVVITAGERPPDDEEREEIGNEIGRLGIESDLVVRHDRTEADGIAMAAASMQSSLIVLPMSEGSSLPASSATATDLIRISGSPVAVVQGDGTVPRRAILALAPEQAGRPGTATALAVALVPRLRRSGVPVRVVSTVEADDSLTEAMADVAVEVDPTEAWLADLGADDLVVVPGGLNGRESSSRTAQQARARGATMLAIADIESVSVADAVAEGLGVVMRPPATSVD